jgi:hypothetical protein
MAWFVSCRLTGKGRGLTITDPVVRARTHANEKAAKEHARIILRLLPWACVQVGTFDATDPSRLLRPVTVSGWLRESDKPIRAYD